MKKLNILNGLMAVFISLPIWFYILYQVLNAINAFVSELLGEE